MCNSFVIPLYLLYESCIILVYFLCTSYHCWSGGREKANMWGCKATVQVPQRLSLAPHARSRSTQGGFQTRNLVFGGFGLHSNGPGPREIVSDAESNVPGPQVQEFERPGPQSRSLPLRSPALGSNTPFLTFLRFSTFFYIFYVFQQFLDIS